MTSLELLATVTIEKVDVRVEEKNTMLLDM